MDINLIEHWKHWNAKIEAEYAKPKAERNTDLLEHWNRQLAEAKIEAQIEAKIETLNAKIEAENDKSQPNQRNIDQWKDERRVLTERAYSGRRDLAPQPAGMLTICITILMFCSISIVYCISL
jgi:hypothetical protein